VTEEDIDEVDLKDIVIDEETKQAIKNESNKRFKERFMHKKD